MSPEVTVVPLDSWYSYTFDHFDPKPGSTLFDKYCKWPMHYDHVWEFMTGLNDSRIDIVEKQTPAGEKPDVITFSHFLPRKELPLPGVYEMAKASVHSPRLAPACAGLPSSKGAPDLTRLGATSLNLAWLDSTRPDSTRLDFIWLDSA